MNFDHRVFEFVHDIAEGAEIGYLGRTKRDLHIPLFYVRFDFLTMYAVNNRNRIKTSILQSLLIEYIGIEPFVTEIAIKVINSIIVSPERPQISKVSIEVDRVLGAGIK